MVRSDISNRWKIVLLCTLFNMLFEFSMRTVSGFLRQPLLFVLLFAIYSSYFTAFEDLILRCRLRDYQVLLIGFIFGMLYLLFGSGSVFAGPLVLGVNPNTIIFVGILWWGMIQGVLAFYFANRIVSRDWQHAKMGKIGWVIAITVNVLALIVLYLNPYLPRGSPQGYAAGISLAVLAVGVFSWSLKRKPNPAYSFEQSIILDVLSFGSALLFVLLGVSLFDNQLMGATYGSPIATTLMIRWTVIVFLVLVVHRYMKQRRTS